MNGRSGPYVPGCEHDIFVSYAHVDDSIDEVEPGWVTGLIRKLRNRLAQRLGRREAYNLWMDHELSRHKPITAEITREIEGTAVLLVVLSPGYVSSHWCDRELNTFLKQVEKRKSGDAGIFVVERLPLDEEEYPKEFSELIGYKFWIKEHERRAPRPLGESDPREKPYVDMLNDLSHDIAAKLKSLKREDSAPATAAPIGAETVFLAEVTDDLEDVRNQVRRFLDQAGVRVLPELYYHRDPDRFREAMKKDLAQSKLFVQLLSGIPGRKSVDLPQGLIALQADIAREAGHKTLQWRSRDLDIGSINDPDHRALLEGENVIALGREELKHEIIEQLRAKPEVRNKPVNAFFFVDMEQSDRSLAESICRILQKHGVGYALPLRQGSPKEIRADLRRNLLDCDVLIVIYGASPLSWVREQLHLARRVLFEREQPLKVLGILEGGEHEKAPIDYHLPNVEMINIHLDQEASEEDLAPFFKWFDDNDEDNP